MLSNFKWQRNICILKCTINKWKTTTTNVNGHCLFPSSCLYTTHILLMRLLCSLLCSLRTFLLRRFMLSYSSSFCERNNKINKSLFLSLLWDGNERLRKQWNQIVSRRWEEKKKNCKKCRKKKLSERLQRPSTNELHKN